MTTVSKCPNIELEHCDEPLIPIDKENNDSCEKFIKEVYIKHVQLSVDQYFDPNVCRDEGSVLFCNRDYFVGQFFGSVQDRAGILTRLSQGLLKSFGSWANGLLKVTHFTDMKGL